MKRIAILLWHRHPVVTVAFLLAVLATLFFTARLVLFAPEFPGGRFPPGPIEGWMTPRMVVHSYPIAPDQLAKVLGIEMGTGKPKTLEQIAFDQGVTVDEIIARIEAALPAKPVGTP